MGLMDCMGTSKMATRAVPLSPSPSTNNPPLITNKLLDKLTIQRKTITKQNMVQQEADKEKVMSWFSAQLCDYKKPELQAAIMESAKAFADTGDINSPSILVEKNEAYTQERLGEMSSAFQFLGRKRPDCIKFLLTVFGSSFTGSQKTTVSRKVKGKKKIRKIVFGDS